MPINVDLLRRALKEEFGSVDGAIRRLGYGDFTKNAFKTKTLKKQCVDALAAWGIRYEDYADDRNEAPQTDDAVTILMEIRDTLSRIEQMLR